MNNLKIELPNGLELSDNKYFSWEISTTQRDEFIKEEFQELHLTAIEWITYSIEECKRELEKNKKEIKQKIQLNNEIREINILNKYFTKHITEWDILGIQDTATYKKDNILDKNYKEIKNLISEKLKKKEQEIEDIKNIQTDIKRICLENIKLILKKENIKAFKTNAETLLNGNGIILGKNHKQKIFHTDTYTQNNIQLYIKKLNK